MRLQEATEKADPSFPVAFRNGVVAGGMGGMVCFLDGSRMSGPPYHPEHFRKPTEEELAADDWQPMTIEEYSAFRQKFINKGRREE